MNKKFAIGACLLGILGLAGVASAGTVDTMKVTFFTDASSGLQGAKGTFKPVRNSADSNQYIGCSIYKYDTGSRSIQCYAHDATTGYRSCSSNDPDMIAIAQSLNPASYMMFQINPDGSTCDRLIAVNWSAAL